MITGARATGKTTTAANHVVHVDRLDQPGTAALYRADPDSALRRAPRPLLIDEWQEVPEVLAAVKRSVDERPAPGQFVLTGSVRAERNNETWAGTGRIVPMSMYPLTEREINSSLAVSPPSFLQRLAASGIDELHLPAVVPDIDGYVRAALRGGFPDLGYHDRSERARGVWLMSYLDDLITRDAATLDSQKDPSKLRRYLRVLALNNAGMPAETTLYRSADVNAKTASSYDQPLRNLFVLVVVPAWANGYLNRLTKAGKRYLVDPGLAAAADGLTAADVLADNDLLGRWFDSFTASQLRPELALTYPRPELHHLRAEAGRREIDLIVELGASQVVALK